MKPTKTLMARVAGYESKKARTMAIARGELKPATGEATVLFASVETFAKVLSQRNRRLLALIAEDKPNSITELATLAGQSRSRISRTLMTMTQYGLVEFQVGEQGRLIPQVAYDQVRLEVSLTAPPGLADSAKQAKSP